MSSNDPSMVDAASKGTIQITRRANRSIRMFELQHLIKPLKDHLTETKTVYPPGSPKLSPPKSVTTSCNVHERRVEEVYIYDLNPKEQKSHAANGEFKERTKKTRLYYFCGGGWQMPPSSHHWALVAEMAKGLPDIGVSVVSYPLAPKSPASVTFPILLKMYRQLLHDAESAGERVILGGDSSGGNIILCLGLTLLAEDESAPSPAALFAMCPTADVRKNNPDMLKVEKHDPVLRIKTSAAGSTAYLGGWDVYDPRVSPLAADLSPAARKGVKIHGIIAGYDILSPDDILFRQKCEQAGVQGQWLEWDKQMHCFPLVWNYGLPEAVQAKDWMVDVLRKT